MKNKFSVNLFFSSFDQCLILWTNDLRATGQLIEETNFQVMEQTANSPSVSPKLLCSLHEWPLALGMMVDWPTQSGGFAVEQQKVEVKGDARFDRPRIAATKDVESVGLRIFLHFPDFGEMRIHISQA
jgi:hypothetical protein